MPRSRRISLHERHPPARSLPKVLHSRLGFFFATVSPACLGGGGGGMAPFLFTEAETDVLVLYDQLQQLQLELALLRSQQQHQRLSETNTSTGGAEQDVASQQAKLLEAKATLDLRNSVVENVVAGQPILNAVHHATHASRVERDLLPCMEQRDAATTTAAALCSDLDSARSQLARVEAESLRTTQRNKKLASEVLQLAGRARGREARTLQGGPFESEIAALEVEVKSSRHKWRIMKGAASAIVAGSGIDWVRDERLRDLVLDPPD